jgi:hypothetical protein
LPIKVYVIYVIHINVKGSSRTSSRALIEKHLIIHSHWVEKRETEDTKMAKTSSADRAMCQ